jgi:hypothetical protein
MKIIDLSDLKAGDKAWSYQYGVVDIIEIDFSRAYPLGTITGTYTLHGKTIIDHPRPTLFHSEQEFLEYLGLESNTLTKREQFAMAAMQGLLNSAAYSKPEHYALASVEQADALLTKLNEKP